MGDQLDGARLKIVRAQQHLKSFNEDGRRYINTEPYKIVSELGPDRVSIEGVITAEPPPALACIIGDFVTNVRASLDYIAWELAMLAGKTLTDGQKRKITFPIAPDKASFSKTNGTADHLESVCGILATTMSVIESVQPYHAGYETLNSLDLLVRIDKHRMLLLCALFMQRAGKFSIYRGNKLAWQVEGLQTMNMDLATFGPSLVGSTDFSMKVEEKPTVYVAIKDFPSSHRLEFVGTLQNILECVANIIPRFESIF